MASEARVTSQDSPGQIEILLAGHLWTEAESQGPEEMCLSLEHQNPAKTAEKWVILIALHFRYTFYILHIKFRK